MVHWSKSKNGTSHGITLIALLAYLSVCLSVPILSVCFYEIYLSIYLSIYLLISRSNILSSFLSFFVLVWLSSRLSVCRYVWCYGKMRIVTYKADKPNLLQFLYPCTYISLSIPIYLSIYLSIYLHVCIYIFFLSFCCLWYSHEKQEPTCWISIQIEAVFIVHFVTLRKEIIHLFYSLIYAQIRRID